jgi:hypothetical protein
MIRKSDWQDALDGMTAEDRRRLGAAPSAEEVAAYMNGELAGEEEARVRELLVAYPELARTLTMPFPEEDEPLSGDQLDRHWAEFQSRVAPPRAESGRVLQFWRAAAALAAALAVVFGALLWRAQSRLDEPRAAWQIAVLEMDGHRGPAGPATVVRPAGESLLLVVPLIGTSEYRQYRLDLASGERTLWKSEPLRRDDDTTSFSIDVPGSYLKPGRYRVELVGVDGAREEKLATYSLQVPAR